MKKSSYKSLLYLTQKQSVLNQLQTKLRKNNWSLLCSRGHNSSTFTEEFIWLHEGIFTSNSLSNHFRIVHFKAQVSSPWINTGQAAKPTLVLGTTSWEKASKYKEADFFPKVGELVCSESDCKCNDPLCIRGAHRVDYAQQTATTFK